MGFNLLNRSISKIGVVGSGQIGPDIALHFVGALAKHGVEVVVVDIAEPALKAGQDRSEKKITKAVDKGKLPADAAEAMRAHLKFTSDDAALDGAEFVIEAATEDVPIKRKIVAQLEERCAAGTLLASNSSHMRPEVIFAAAKHPECTMVVHYFFPADRNVVVEVVPGDKTDTALADWAMAFYTEIGKRPIRVGSRYGYAVDPIFEGLFQAAALCVEAGLGTAKQIDAIAQEALGLGVGPFTAMNLTGGNPITDHGLDQMNKELGPWFRSPQLLKDHLEKNEPWDVARRGEKVELAVDQFDNVAASMRGAYFGLVGQILDSGITNVGDLEMALEAALAVKPPFSWMNELGTKAALELIEVYAKEHPEFVVPDCIKKQAASGETWPL